MPSQSAYLDVCMYASQVREHQPSRVNITIDIPLPCFREWYNIIHYLQLNTFPREQALHFSHMSVSTMKSTLSFVRTSTFHFRNLSQRHPLSARRIRTIRLSSGPPPKVKPTFYKNPSKAIQKGGGFYIPGLRGPRLRVAVSALAVTLLALNHLSISVNAIPRSLWVSESFALTASIGILVTALVDISTEREEMAPAGQQQGVSSLRAAITTTESSVKAKSGGIDDVGEEVSWGQAVCADLTNATAFAICRDGKTIYVSGLAEWASEAGAAVARVAQEKRAVYIDDTSVLPPEITLPFLSKGTWAVYLVPSEEEVVAFATAQGSGFDKRQRDWLEQLAIRMARGCRKG